MRRSLGLTHRSVRRGWVGLVVAAALVALVPLTTHTADAAPPTGTYPAWTVAGASAAWSGTVTFDGVANFPVGTYASGSSQVTSPTGASAFLNAGTPFGGAFGSSQGKPYLTVRTAPGNAPSTTTITFAGPTPASGWGFALGDIDADQVTVTATGADGAPVATDALGFAGTFNSCATGPLPSSCSGPATDVPTWDPNTATLSGNTADTSGAAGWFRPTASLRSVTFVFSALSGIPIYQLWMAATVADMGGTVVTPGPAGGSPQPVPGAVVELVDGAGAPVAGPDGGPVTTVTGDDGSFAIPGVVTGDYELVVTPPSGLDPTTVPVDLTAGDVTGLSIAVLPTAAAPTTPAAPLAVTPRFTG
jgi:hypothetical protein